MFDVVLFAVFPYLAVALAVLVGLLRYAGDRFTFSSLSSQFLESRALFWGSVSWHYAILVVLLAHLLPLVFPASWAALIAEPARLYVLEVIGLALGLLALIGLVVLFARRLGDSRARIVTSLGDWILLAVLLAQVVLGFWVALVYRWGSDWYVHTAVPWLLSLVTLAPRVEYVTALPWVVKLHMLGGFVLLAIFPFTRLVHVVVPPVSYLWRPWQVVIWNRRPVR
ncbi:MAG: respiratory nitrate reductase subunit gamma [Candidatus Rokubacteria bacterium]|nr:respiratory nitrate reductase subunit gamma [Candidatus Rokubacteria bacterium]